jgi:hypothetical protein
MESSLEDRVAELERKWLRHEAESVFLIQAVGVLLALIDACADAAKLRVKPSIRELYTKMLREQTEKFLAMMADHDPKLASQLREILKSQLDQQIKSDDEDEIV